MLLCSEILGLGGDLGEGLKQTHFRTMELLKERGERNYSYHNQDLFCIVIMIKVSK